ncbi:MAG: hypothetical protein F8N37_12300 [Telmatospirillum sp.]|nr:hypothetical protein [Telmatospirillum sp.]
MIATRSFHKIELVAYFVLGLLLALTALVGIVTAAQSLFETILHKGDLDLLVTTIDRLLFVLMLVEILHTVRVSFLSGTLVCEPFLIVGLIASVRRVLVITLESTQASQKGAQEAGEILHATMLELGILGGMILIMVISIVLLRRAHEAHAEHV